MADFSINIKVDLGVTPELTTLVMAVLQGRPTEKKEMPETVKTVTVQTAEEKNEDAASGAVEKPKRGRKPKVETAPAETTDEKNEEAAAVPESETAAGQTDAPTPNDAPKQLSTADIREAMDKVRKRIEGEDYKNQTNSEPYKKYHQALSGEFINMASLLGFKKPSDINTQEGMEAFIAQCEELAVDKDGSITHKCPY